MHMYFSGIGGVGIGPLALICRDAGYTVSGSDAAESLFTNVMRREGINFSIGQDGTHIAQVHQKQPIDWMVVSSALPADHPEIIFAKKMGVKITKRSEVINWLLEQKNLKMVGVTGTHGKTTITGMLVWLFKQFDVPVSYSIGTSISFANSGAYQDGGNYFVYECDEYDRNMLAFHPYLGLITMVDYDHPDIYPTRADYEQAFKQFAQQCELLIMRGDDAKRLGLEKNCTALIEPNDPRVKLSTLAGQHNRENAWQAAVVFKQLFPDKSYEAIMEKLNLFPGTDRRFERLAPNIYTDYAHHPAEIRATLQLARELNDKVVAVYQPHQNIRQHELKNEYSDSFEDADHVYWLPTYLSRENPDLAVLTPQELISGLVNKNVAEPAQMDDALAKKLRQHAADGALVLFMGAGDIDTWARQYAANS